MSNEMKLFGKRIIIPAWLIQYNRLYLEFKKYASEQADKWQQIYTRFGDIETFSKRGFNEGCALIDEVTEKAIAMLLSADIITVNKEKFYSRYYSKYYSWEDIYEEINEQYLSIIYDQEQMDEYRTARRLGRSRWVGGGFGVSGTVKGAMTAGAMNMASGALYGAVNLVGKVGSSIGASYSKSKLYNAESTKSALRQGIYQNCFSILSALVDVFTDNGFTDIANPSQSDIETAKALTENIRNSAFPKEKEEKTVIDILTSYPYDPSIYTVLMDKYPAQMGMLLNISQYFSVDMSDYVKEKLDEKYQLLHSQIEEESLESVIQFKKDFLEYARSISLNRNHSYLQSYKETLDNQITQKKEEELLGFLKTLDISSAEETEVSVQLLQQFCEKLGIENNRFYDAEQQLRQKYEQSTRKVGEVIFDTVQEAELARKDHDTYQEFLSTVDISNRQSIQDAMEFLFSKESESPASVDYYNFLLYKNIELQLMEKLPNTVIPKEIKKELAQMESCKEKISHAPLAKLLNINPVIEERLINLSASDYRKKYNNAYDYQTEGKVNFSKIFWSLLSGVLVYFIFRFVIGFFTKQYDEIIALVLTVIGVVGSLRDELIGHKSGKQDWGEITAASGRNSLPKYE